MKYSRVLKKETLIFISDEEDVEEKLEPIVKNDEHIKKIHEHETVDETIDEGSF